MKRLKGAKMFVYVFCFLLIMTHPAFSGDVKSEGNGQITIMSYNLAGPFGLTFSIKDIFSGESKENENNKNNFGVNYTRDGENISTYNGVSMSSGISQGSVSEQFDKNNNQNDNTNKSTGFMIEFKMNF